MCIPWAAMGYRTLFLKAYGFEDWEARAQRGRMFLQLQDFVAAHDPKRAGGVHR